MERSGKTLAILTYSSTGKDDDGNKSLGVVNMETGFQVLKLDGTTQGENAARKGVQN